MGEKDRITDKRHVREAKERAIREAKEAEEEAKRLAKEKAIREAQEAKDKAKREAEEAKERAKKEAEEAKKAKEAEEKAREKAERLAKEKAIREAKEAEEEAREAEEKARKEAKRLAKEKAKREAKEKARFAPYEGIVKLVIMSLVDSDHMKELEENLRQIQNLRLVLIGGSVKKGIQIVISVEKPTPLIGILKEMPLVEEVVDKGEEIQVTLKAKQ